ncbi:MAG: 5'/3'-nucleotidase SurE [Pseudonocardia sp.]
MPTEVLPGTGIGPTGDWALVTNDDGIDAPGLHALAGAAVEAGMDVVVAAPAEEASGAGASIISARRDGVVPVVRRELAGLGDVPAYAVAGHPAFIAFAALNGWFDQPPSLLLSGINWGANLGTAVLHSGTVGAALAASRQGVRALAVSLDCGHLPPGVAVRWDSAAGLVPKMVELLAGCARGTVLSLNVPNLAPGSLGEPMAAVLAERGRWKPEVRAVEDGLRVRGARRPGTLEPGSDAALLAAGHPTVTALLPVGQRDTAELAAALTRTYRRPA